MPVKLARAPHLDQCVKILAELILRRLGTYVSGLDKNKLVEAAGISFLRPGYRPSLPSVGTQDAKQPRIRKTETTLINFNITKGR